MAGNCKLTFEWDVESTKLLINLYKANECLYNDSHNDFKSRGIRLAAIAQIANLMTLETGKSCTVGDIRRKINMLRAQYHMEKMKVMKCSNSGSHYTPTEFWFPHLQFLDPYSRVDLSSGYVPLNEEIGDSQVTQDLPLQPPLPPIRRKKTITPQPSERTFSFPPSASTSHLDTEPDPHPHITSLCNFIKSELICLQDVGSSEYVRKAKRSIQIALFEVWDELEEVKMDTKMKPKKKVKKPKPKRFTCSICPKAFADRGSLNKHEPTHSAETPFACSLCAYAGKTAQYLRRHVKVTHERDRKYRCEECGKTFHFGCKLKSHMLVHTGEKPYKCDECDKAFNSSYSLTTHKLIHAGSKPFKCSFCAYACRDSSSLRKHHAIHTGTEKYYQCTMCCTSVKSKANLKLHVAEKHLDIDVKRFICDACGKRFKMKASLSLHIQIVHEKSRTAKCDICGLKITNRSNLPAHMRTHVAHRPFVCGVDVCRRRFKCSSSLSKHSRTHFPSKQVGCEACGKRFARAAHLERHARTHRPRVRRVECAHCGVRFYGKNYLIRHIQRKHSRKKQKYICDLCEFVTGNKPSLVMHIKYGHERLKPLNCDVCDKKFKRPFFLQQHYWKAHDIELKMTTTIKKPKKPVVTVKEEPQDFVDENEAIRVVPKIEPIDEAQMLIEDLACAGRNQMQDLPPGMLEELIQPTEKPPEEKRHPPKDFVDRKAEEEVKKKVKELLEETRRKKAHKALERARKKAHKALERARKKYNRLMKKALENIVTERKKIIRFNNNEDSNSLLVEDYSIFNGVHNLGNRIDKEEAIDNVEPETIDEDTGNGVEVESIDNQDGEIESAKTNDAEENGRNRKLKINSHQCYVCYELFNTKQKLIDHCKYHFNRRNTKTLKKCPLCDYKTDLSVTKHLRNKHNINIKVPYGSFKEKDDEKGSKYFYDVKDKGIDTVEIIPGVNNMNRREYINIDKRNRDSKNKGLTKTKLVKKGKEWIVVKEKIKVDKHLLPKFNEMQNIDVKGGFVEKMKVLSRLAKKNGVKMLFPCDSCDKVCQTLSALKLHSRKHQANPKPFRPKVWKHKVDKTQAKQGKQRKLKDTTVVQSNEVNANRTANPKPVSNKHRCEKELIEFYEQNIKGGDIEFWQFLKIYNKIGRENMDNLDDLDNTNEYGVPLERNNVIEENEVRNKVVRRRKVVKKDAFTRVVRLSREEVLRRNEIKMRLRQNNMHNM